MTTKTSPRKMPAKKVEAFVEERIEQVRSLWRQREVTAQFLRFALMLAGYALVFALFDLTTHGSNSAFVISMRYLLFGVFLVLAGWTGTQFVLGLRRRLNPYFVARHLEQSIPDAKNSVINWLDLKDEAMAPAIRGSLSQQAASSLKQTDPEDSAEATHGWIWGLGLALVAVGLIILLVWRPTQFGSLMQRAFVPFQGTSLASRVRIEMKNPAEGNAVVSDRQGLEVVAEISGSVPAMNEPGAPTLHYRYQDQEAFAALPMLLDNSGFWMCRLSRDQVQSGLSYKITAADASTPIYQIKVRPTPLATKFEITYTPRAYRGQPERRAEFPNEKYALPRIQDYRGTKVKLLVHTNVPVRDGRLELEAHDRQQPPRVIPMTLSPDNPRLLAGEFALEQSGEMRVAFVSKDGDDNADRRPYDVLVLGDDAPVAVINKPGKDITLPANGTLGVEGTARDDVGLQRVDLHFKVGTTKLKPRSIAKIADKETQLQVDFFEVLPLEQMHDSSGKPYPFAKGHVLEYWLEASDRCDVPASQLGKSKVYKVNIVDPHKDNKDQKQERQKAQDDKKKHDDQKKEDDKKKDDDKKKEENKQNQGGGDNNKPKDPQQDKLNNVLEDAQKKKEQQENRGGSKGDDKQQQDNKSKGEPKSNDNKSGEPQPQGAQNKDKNETKSPPSQAKDQGDKQQQPGAGQAKDKGPEEKKPDPQTGNNPAQAKSEGNDKGADKKDQGQAKSGQGDKQPQSQQAKDKGAGDDKQSAPQAKDAKNEGPMKDQGDKGQSKAGPSQQPPQKGDDKQAPSQAKGQQQPEEKANAKNEPSQGGGDKKPGVPQAQQKAGNDPAQAAGKDAPKEDPGKGGKVVGRGKEDMDPKRDATPEELEQIKKLAKEKGPDGEGASKALADMAKHSGDPKFKKAMEEFLKENGRPDLAKEIKDGPKSEGPQTPVPQPQEAKGGKQPDDPNATPANPGNKTKSGTDNEMPAANPMAANDPFGRKGGNLQLEDLKKLVTPEMLKKSGLTEKDWAQFLADAAKNKDLLPKMQKDRRDDLLKGKGSLPSQGIRTIEPGATDTGLDRIQVGPPPELRQDYIEFTSPKKK